MKMKLFNVWYRKDPGSICNMSRIKKEIVASSIEAALTDFEDQYKGIHPIQVEEIFYIGEW